jgi:hypothetical protein
MKCQSTALFQLNKILFENTQIHFIYVCACVCFCFYFYIIPNFKNLN